MTPPLYVTPAHGLCAAELNLRSWVDWAPLHNFAESATFSERQKSVVSARDVSHDFFRLRWAFPLIKLVGLLGWPFYSWWPFARKTSTLLKSFKSKLTIKTSSQKATLPVIKFGWIANTSKPNKTKSLRLSSSNYFEYYIL